MRAEPTTFGEQHGGRGQRAVPPGRLRPGDPRRQVVFDTGISTGDYPRGYTVTTSTDGVTWSTAVASGSGTGQFTTVPLTGAPVRYVRITLTAASGSWFSVADVRAYTAGRGMRPWPRLKRTCI